MNMDNISEIKNAPNLLDIIKSIVKPKPADTKNTSKK